MAPGASGLSAGDVVAGYRIAERLGQGGMASVYLARDERLGRQVALKILAKDLSDDMDFRHRFIRESRAAAAVDHPNIIPIFGAGEDDGVLYIAMRYARDGDARRLLSDQGPLPPQVAMAIIAPVAGALDAAHEAGVVHRDVKPANMLLDRRAGSMHVYLADFGITAVGTEPDLTKPGLAIGTPHYMSPEQAQGGAVDGRADQWGLACSAFALLSDSTPFSGENAVAIVYAIVTSAPAKLTDLRPNLPPAVDAVFSRALAKSPEDRYGTCSEFAEALSAALGLATAAESWLRGGPQTPRAASALDDKSGAGGRRGTDRSEYQKAAPPTTAPPTAWQQLPTGPVPVPFQGTGQHGTLDIALKETFRYVHEPSRADDDALPSLGNDELIGRLEKRLRHSRGGTFLITGFRGVGKSTLVMRALDELSARSGPSDVVVPISLSVARSTTTERLLFAIVRRIFETLSDEGVLDRLPPQTRHALLVSYMRTSLSYKETQSKGSQQSAGLNIGLGAGDLVKAVADIAAPQVSLSASRSQSLAIEAAFLAYSETDVEYDLMRIISLVNRTLDAPRRSWLRRLQPRWLQRHGLVPPPRLRLVVVLDEVDKLTVDDRGMAAVEELLSGTKNVLTMSGAHFLVIAGPDLQDRALRDAARGTGIYESVFGWRLYVPCVWDAPERLVRDAVRAGEGPDPEVVAKLVAYLRFKARGMPRRLLQEINALVSWPEDRPRLQIGRQDMLRIEFYARIEEILRGFMEGTDRASLFPIAIDEDRWQLGGYFVVDWVLQSKEEPFIAADLLREGEDARFDPLLRLDKESVERLLDHLASHGILSVVREEGAMNTLFPDVKQANAKTYRLSHDIHRLLSGIVERYESRAFEGASARPQQADVARLIGERYELGELIGQGSLGAEYKGRDVATGRQVVIKLLPSMLAEDPVALARFRREAEIITKLDHPQVVRTYAFVNGPHDYAIVTERLLGQSLRTQVELDGSLSPSEVVGLGQVLADGLSYLAAHGVVRLDLKPANIVLADRGPVIADLSVALQDVPEVPTLTVTGMVIGTPAFMAPELIEGADADQRSDIYSLGLVLFYCLGGKLPWAGLPNPIDVMSAVLLGGLDMSGLDASPSLQSVLRRATASKPEDRFQDGAAFSDALLATAEGQALQVPGQTLTVRVPQARQA